MTLDSHNTLELEDTRYVREGTRMYKKGTVLEMRMSIRLMSTSAAGSELVLALAVTAALAASEAPLLVEAGTGTGTAGAAATCARPVVDDEGVNE